MKSYRYFKMKDDPMVVRVLLEPGEPLPSYIQESLNKGEVESIAPDDYLARLSAVMHAMGEQLSRPQSPARKVPKRKWKRK